MQERRILKLLVVDDEPLLIRALARVLRGRLDVVGAADGETALAAVLGGEVDAILAEASVVDGNGRSFLRVLETEQRAFLPKLILASGGRDMNVGFYFKERYGCPFLFKPIDGDTLVEVVERIAAGR